MSASLTSYLLRYLLRVGDKFRSSGRQAVELALDQRLSDAAIGPPVTTTFLIFEAHQFYSSVHM
jgi:hypothetical protein